MKDFSKQKFRCSSLPILMTSPRSKSEILSETAKSYLRELWIKEMFGREKLDTINKYTTKGIAVESDSLELVQNALGETFFKNKIQLENEFLTGTPDVKSPKVVDIKSSWDIWTFMSVDEKKAYKDYYFQLLGYMILTGLKSADLIYCLTNTPEMLIQEELYRMSFVHGDSDEFQKKARKNYIFDDIDKRLRVKKYVFEFDEFLAGEVIVKINAAREYMQGVGL